MDNDNTKYSDIATNSSMKNDYRIPNNIQNYSNNTSEININDNNNLNYINGMNIRCRNLNINNFTNLNNNLQNINYYDPNYQNFPFQFNQNFLQNNNQNIPFINYYNNQLQYNQFKTFGIPQYNLPNYNNMYNMLNYQNNLYQNNYINNNINNNLNNTNDNNNFMNDNNIQKNNINNNINNNDSYINMQTQNKPKNETKKKKTKRLDPSIYMDKPLSVLADKLDVLGKDQGACRYLQKILDNNPNETIHELYNSICQNILSLINDPFGNYLIQKIICYLNQEQLCEIMKIISSSFYDICTNTHGTRVLQKLIEHSTSLQAKNTFYKMLKPLIVHLLKDLNGTFVVQKFAEFNKNEFSNDINEIIIENSPVLSTHRHGCCVIQKYLELKDEKMTPLLLDKLIDNCLLLIIDQFGNYVIQTILLMGEKKYGNKLAEKVAENVVYYAKHKYSSNVIEKCFDYCDGIYLENLMANVQKKDNLSELILDEHGNYVVQKVLSKSSQKQQKMMLEIIVSLFEKLKNCPHGERVINRLMMSYPNLGNN